MRASVLFIGRNKNALLWTNAIKEEKTKNAVCNNLHSGRNHWHYDDNQKQVIILHKQMKAG